MMAAAVPSVERFAQPVRRALQGDFMRHGALVFGATMAGNVLNYLFNFALSRRLGVEGFATLSSLVSFIMVFSIPASILTLIVVKYTATFHAADDSQRVRRLSQVLLKWTSIAAVIAFGIGVSLSGEVSGFLRIPRDAAVPLCLAILALSFITPSVRAILQGEQDFVRYSISMVLEIFLKVLMAVALVYGGFGVTGAMFGWLGGIVIALAYTVWAVMRKHGSVPGKDVHLSLDVRRLVRTSAGVGLASALLIVLSFMDVMLVKHYFDPHQAGLYAAVNLTGKVVLFLAGFVPAVVLPKAIAKTTRGENALPMLLQAMAVTISLSGAAACVFGALSYAVVRVIAGHDFVSAAPYVFQYDVAMALLAIVTVLVNYRIGIHRFDFLYGLVAVLVFEVGSIVAFHNSLWDVIHILLFGNALAIGACCLGLGRRGTVPTAHGVPEHA